MAASPEQVGLIFLVTGAVLVALIREPLRHPGRPGSAGFAVTVVGLSLWPFAVGVTYFLSSTTLAIVAWEVRVLAAAILSIGWVLVALEYTERHSPTGRVLVPLAAYLLVGVVVLATNPLHHLAAGQEAALSGGTLDPDEGPWFWIQLTINYGLILGATALFVDEAIRSSGLRRTQSVVLAATVVPPILANLATNLDLVDTPHDLTPFGLVGSGLLLSWALYRVDFLNVVPIARQTAMAVMRDAVVTLDERNRVVDCNAAAREQFDVGDDYVGMTPSAFFDSIPEHTLERFDGAEEVDTLVSTEIDGECRYVSLSISPVLGPRGSLVGKVLVLRDVTEMKRREEALRAREMELDILRQVLSRALRHDIRTELGVIRGHADDLAATVGAEDAEHVRAIREASDNLLVLSEKARSVERVVDGATQVGPCDLRRIVDDVVASARERHPDVSIQVSGPDACTVRASYHLESAVENLVENAAEYGDATDPRVSIRLLEGTDGVSLAVADNGPGIPRQEVTALHVEAETPLTHGSGIGLWIVKWVVDHSGATLAFESNERGTTVTITFEEAVDFEEGDGFEEGGDSDASVDPDGWVEDDAAESTSTTAPRESPRRD